MRVRFELSDAGGSDIETLSAEHPDAIFKIPIDIEEGLTEEKLEEVSNKLGFQSTKVSCECRRTSCTQCTLSMRNATGEKSNEGDGK